jgi:hypothetical protein
MSSSEQGCSTCIGKIEVIAKFHTPLLRELALYRLLFVINSENELFSGEHVVHFSQKMKAASTRAEFPLLRARVLHAA